MTVSLGSSDKDHVIQGGMKRKRKKCSDHDKAGKLNFGFESLVTIPPVFLVFVFFEIVNGIFHFGTKRSQNSVKFELEKGRPRIERLVIFPLF